MDLNQYLDKVSRPISEANPIGERLSDDVLFDYVEGQMMKVGSLSHSEVQWHEVESAALKLLETKSKDLKLLTYLLQCLQHQCSLERFSCSLALLERFMASFWETCHPAPGPRGVLPRRKFFAQIVQRTLKAAEGLDTDFCDPDTKSVLLQSLKALCDTAAAKELPVDELQALEAKLKRRFSSEPANKPKPAQESSAGESRSSSESRDMPRLEIDNSSDKATKQALLKVADFIAENPAGMALGLRLRRFAIWFSVTSAPENANAKGETSLMPISADRVAEYRSQLAKSPDLALLRRIEQSLSLSPFWIDGHCLSAQLAQTLGQPAWAQAILEETAAFVERLPALLDMSFKGGVPFVSKETRSWLNGSEQQGSGSAEGNSYEQEIWELAASGGLSLAFAALNDKLHKATEPRDKFYLRLLGADLKDKHQLGAMAEVEYQVLLGQATDTSLADWEPGLMSRLQQKVNLS